MISAICYLILLQGLSKFKRWIVGSWLVYAIVEMVITIIILVLMLSPTYNYLNVGEDNQFEHDYGNGHAIYEGVLNKYFSYCLTKILGFLKDDPTKDRLTEIYLATIVKVFGFVSLWCQFWFWIVVWGAYCEMKKYVAKRDPMDRCMVHCFPCCC